MVLGALREWRRPGGMLAAVVLMAVLPAGAATIDNFMSVDPNVTWPFSVTTATTATVLERPLDTNNVIGGARHTSLTATGLNVPGVDIVQVGVFPAAALFDFNSTVQADGRVRLMYNADDVGLDADLTADFLVQIDFLAFDLADGLPLPVTVTMTDGGGQTSFLTRTLTTAGPQSVQFEFADFSGIGAFNLADVDEILVEFDPGMAADFRVGQIFTDVPEPATLAVLVVGGLVLGRRRAR
jgi:hypothetical protein